MIVLTPVFRFPKPTAVIAAIMQPKLGSDPDNCHWPSIEAALSDRYSRFCHSKPCGVDMVFTHGGPTGLQEAFDGVHPIWSGPGEIRYFEKKFHHDFDGVDFTVR